MLKSEFIEKLKNTPIFNYTNKTIPTGKDSLDIIYFYNGAETPSNYILNILTIYNPTPEFPDDWLVHCVFTKGYNIKQNTDDDFNCRYKIQYINNDTFSLNIKDEFEIIDDDTTEKLNKEEIETIIKENTEILKIKNEQK